MFLPEHVSIFCRFTKKDKGFSSGIKSKNIRRFYTKDYQEIEEVRKGYCQEKDRKKEEQENKETLARFKKRSLKIVKFILDGNCHSYLLNILQRKRPSRRYDIVIPFLNVELSSFVLK